MGTITDASSLLEELRQVVGPSQVLVDEDLRAHFETDWTRRWTGTSLAVVRPGTTGEVREVLVRCAARGAAVVPQGGNTGLVGGAVPTAGSIVLSTTRLDTIDDPNPLTGEVLVGAGATLGAVQAAARGAGWNLGVDLAARDTATIGGMVATNAGGIRVIKYGMMRRQVIGVEAVLADGSILTDLRGLPKDNTGYDLTGLFCGSEGTLGIITAIKLQLVPPAAARVAAMIGLTNLTQGIDIVGSLRRRLPTLEAAEYISAAAMQLVREFGGLASPLPGDHGGYLLLECAADSDPTGAFAAAIEDVGDIEHIAVATDAGPRQRLWGYRESISDAVAAAGIPQKLDVSLPLARLAAFEQDLLTMLAADHPRAQVFNFGHVGDGNLHINILAEHSSGDTSMDRAVLELVAQHQGSVSAEHGIGRAKAFALQYTRSPVEIATMRAIKRALDPAGMLNPEVLFPQEPEA